MKTSSLRFHHFESSSKLDTILVAEDNEDMRYYISQCLHTKFRTIEASNGTQALSLVLEYLPSLIITDLIMPGLNGIELCQQLKSNPKTNFIPVIIITGNADQKTRIEGLRAGANDYITKPFYVNELMIRITNMIEVNKNLKEKYTSRTILKPTEINIPSEKERFLIKVLESVEKNIDNPLFGVDLFAQEVGLSTIQLYRKLVTLTGQSPVDFVRNFRLQRAADLLNKRVGNIAEVAYLVGFSTLSYFSKCFRDKFGYTPKEYRQSSA